MHRTISSEELKNNLEVLRKILKDFDTSKIGNVIFYDIDSFYAFLKNETYADTSIEDIMDKIQPFIPISITEDSLDLFLQASAVNDMNEMSALESKFKNRTRIDFINTIKNVRNDIEWSGIVEICETIRDYKESCVACSNL